MEGKSVEFTSPEKCQVEKHVELKGKEKRPDEANNNTTWTVLGTRYWWQWEKKILKREALLFWPVPLGWTIPREA